jgi:hypothetical protein
MGQPVALAHRIHSIITTLSQTGKSMSTIQGGPGRGRYLIIANDKLRLRRFVHDAHKDPELDLIETIGPNDAPHTAVYEMAHNKAASLQQGFQSEGALRIEPDKPLSLFGNA